MPAFLSICIVLTRRFALDDDPHRRSFPVLAAPGLLFAGGWIWRSVEMICAVGRNLCYRTNWATRSATSLILQSLQTGNGNVQLIAFFAQLREDGFQIHSAP